MRPSPPGRKPVPPDLDWTGEVTEQAVIDDYGDLEFVLRKPATPASSTIVAMRPQLVKLDCCDPRGRYI
jgi:hypothetical protein